MQCVLGLDMGEAAEGWGICNGRYCTIRVWRAHNIILWRVYQLLFTLFAHGIKGAASPFPAASF